MATFQATQKPLSLWGGQGPEDEEDGADAFFPKTKKPTPQPDSIANELAGGGIDDSSSGFDFDPAAHRPKAAPPARQFNLQPPDIDPPIPDRRTFGGGRESMDSAVMGGTPDFGGQAPEGYLYDPRPAIKSKSDPYAEVLAKRQALMHKVPIQSEYKPNIWQKLGVIGLGAASGYLNSTGKPALRQDPHAMQGTIAALSHPGYGAAMEKWGKERQGVESDIEAVERQMQTEIAQRKMERELAAQKSKENLDKSNINKNNAAADASRANAKSQVKVAGAGIVWITGDDGKPIGINGNTGAVYGSKGEVLRGAAAKLTPTEQHQLNKAFDQKTKEGAEAKSLAAAQADIDEGRVKPKSDYERAYYLKHRELPRPEKQKAAGGGGGGRPLTKLQGANADAAVKKAWMENEQVIRGRDKKGNVWSSLRPEDQEMALDEAAKNVFEQQYKYDMLAQRQNPDYEPTLTLEDVRAKFEDLAKDVRAKKEAADTKAADDTKAEAEKNSLWNKTKNAFGGSKAAPAAVVQAPAPPQTGGGIEAQRASIKQQYEAGKLSRDEASAELAALGMRK